MENFQNVAKKSTFWKFHQKLFCIRRNNILIMIVTKYEVMTLPELWEKNLRMEKIRIFLFQIQNALIYKGNPSNSMHFGFEKGRYVFFHSLFFSPNSGGVITSYLVTIMISILFRRTQKSFWWNFQKVDF